MAKTRNCRGCGRAYETRAVLGRKVCDRCFQWALTHTALAPSALALPPARTRGTRQPTS